MATSGTVSATFFNQRKVIDHAMRRAGMSPEQASAEQLQIASENIYSLTAEWINSGFPLWTREYLLLSVAQGQTDVTCPVGTVDVRHAYWRIFNPWRGAATLSSGGSGAVLFAGQPNSDVTIPGPNASVTVPFTTPTEVDTVGVLLGGSASLTAALQIQGSGDGVTFTPLQTLPNTTFQPGVWSYFDPSPTLTTSYLQIVLPTGTWVLNQLNLGLANGQDIEIGPLNIDDYYNLPNKAFQSDQPNSAYVDRQLDQPVLKIWPTPSQYAAYNGTVTALVRRYIQDPGALYNAIEVPQRWLEALIWRLACNLIYELPDQDNSSQANYYTLMAKQQRIQAIEAKAQKSEALAWSEERVRAPIRWMPNIACYTR